MSTESTYVVNVKTALGTIVTVRGDTAQELANNINEFEQNAVALSVSALEQLLAGKPATPTVASVVSALGATVVEEKSATFAPIPPAASTPVAGGRECKHGTMTYRTGQGAKGPWKGYFCPTPKGTPDQCSPQFVR